MPRLVRRAPLGDRIRNYIWDTLLWISEEFNGEDWADAQKEWALPIGFVLNLAFLIARANTGGQSQSSYDVFGDSFGKKGSSLFQWLCSLVVLVLGSLSCANAAYTFLRRRHYRLFEAPVDVVLATPSAHRVRIDSSPVVSSPLRFLTSVLSSATAESRAHPDPSRDVWELAVWDPTPICLRLFCLFSPGHVLVYCLFLPIASLDPQPSVTVATTILLAVLLSAQLHLLQSAFSQQMKDQAVISKEVLHEYDTKFVHPTLHRPVRDVSTQTPSKRSPKSAREVETYTPTTIINRGFHTNPNPAYSAYYDRDAILQSDSQEYQTQPPLRSLGATPPLRTPMPNGHLAQPPTTISTATTTGTDFLPSSPIRAPAGGPRAGYAAPQNFPRLAPSPMKRDGGSLGVYSHAASPLRKTASTSYLGGGGGQSADERPGNAAAAAKRRKEGSPLKRTSTPADFGLGPKAGGAAERGQRSRYF